MKLSRSSLALLALQLVLISSIAAKYWYERSHCPRVWTRAVTYDPSLVLRGRYLSMQLTVDGCQSTLPKASQAEFPRNLNGVPISGAFSVAAPQVVFQAKLDVRDHKLIAIRLPDSEENAGGEDVVALAGVPCDQLRLSEPVDFYIAENAASPLPIRPGQQLWVEVTVPPQGPPRPIQLALKENGVWKPLAYQ